MAKDRRTLRTSLPAYQRDRSQWRQQIHAAVMSAARKAGVHYSSADQLEVVVLLYLSRDETGKRLAIHDVDNRLKDILDALQGRFGSLRSTSCLVDNDNKQSSHRETEGSQVARFGQWRKAADSTVRRA